MFSVNEHDHDHPVDDHDDNLYQHLKHWHSSADESDFQLMVYQIKHVLRKWSKKTPDLVHYLRSISMLPVLADLCKFIRENSDANLDSPLVAKIVHQTITIEEAELRIGKLVSSHKDGFSEYLKSLDNFELLILFSDALFDPPDSESSHNEPEILNKDEADSEVRQSFAATFRGPAVELLVAHLESHERGNKRHRDAAALRRQAERRQAEESDDVEMQDADLLPASTSTPSSSPLERRLAASNTAPTVPSSTSPSTSSEEQDMYYAKVLPIIQSSGFGKTKLCVTLSASHPGMLICMRPESTVVAVSEPKVAVSFPPQDTKVFEYFNKCYEKYFVDVGGVPLGLDILEQNHVHVYVVFFLAAYCNELHSLLSQIMLISGCPPLSPSLGDPAATHPTNSSPSATNDTHQVAQCWNSAIHALATAIHVKPDFLAQLEFQPQHPICPHSKVRGQDFANPTPSAIAALKRRFPSQHRDFVGKLAGPTTRADMLKRICDQAEKYLAEYTPTATSREYLVPLDKHLRPALLQLESLVPSSIKERTFFFLAFDECMPFLRMLPHIRRVWHAAKPDRTWLLLVDTNSRIAPIIGREARDSTHRTKKEISRLTQPFVDMPLDVYITPEDSNFIRQQIADGNFTLRDVNKLITRIGRPLWNDKPYTHPEHILQPRYIFAKLVQPFTWEWPASISGNKDHKSDSKALQNILALVSQRVALEHSILARDQSWLAYLRGQVSHHLRFLCDFCQDSNVITTTIPSEPPLSLAATWSFRCGTRERVLEKWSMAIDMIGSAHSSIGLNVGLQGKEGVRILCSIAADLAANRRHQSLVLRRSSYEGITGLIKLSEWLACLVGAERQHEASDDPCWLWCSRQWVNFKHTAELHNQVQTGTSINRNILGELWMRHAAMRGVSNQCGWDILFPVYEHDSDSPPIGDEPFLASKLSYVAIQIKNWAARPQPPTTIGPSLPGLVTGDKTTSLELFFDIRAPQAEVSLSHKVHENHPFQDVHRLVIRGNSSATFPFVKELDDSAKLKIPILFGLPTAGDDDHGYDMTEYIREAGSHLARYSDRAAVVKAGHLNMTECIPDTISIEAQSRSGRTSS
ncbi:uncharacterized protein UTRI_04421 [Ustilago trichophora]|uniref:Uncharacterized protein n=1 Tax=Ustilago trichophora TaxID=86804 RepID=A0A5C3ED35_9BASI|nr:uncharacterized protein UTRI_04421 [Ustilago trichophora]